MDQLIRQSQALAARVSSDHKRYLFHEIDWTQRLIGIKGARGTGKTTLVLQRMQQTNASIYLTLDDLWFSTHTLTDTITSLHQKGTTYFYLDEVHKYDGWSKEVKNLFDFHPDVHLIVTGSSIIELNKLEVDLSRRLIVYELPGLSFREYLDFTGVYTSKPMPLDEIVSNQAEICSKIIQSIRPLEHFEAYLKFGYYPFFLEGESVYHIKLKQIIRLIIETDITLAEGVPIDNVRKLTRLLHFVAQSSPFKPNVSQIAGYTELDRGTLLRYLSHLEKARLMNQLHVPGGGLSALAKPDKIYLQNTNLMFALSETQPDMGNVRETFFLSQLNPKHQVEAPDNADFLVNERYIFEVGGKTKTKKQLLGRQNAVLALDDIEIGAPGQVPLWLFGWLYDENEAANCCVFMRLRQMRASQTNSWHQDLISGETKSNARMENKTQNV